MHSQIDINKMKNLLNLLTLSLTIFSIISCSVEPIEVIENEYIIQNSIAETNESSLTCNDANPQARLVNNGTVPFNFVILSVDSGSIIQISNVMPNSTTSWNSFSEGDTYFSIVSSTTGVSDMKVNFSMNNCTELDVIIDSSNHLVNTQPVVIQ